MHERPAPSIAALPSAFVEVTQAMLRAARAIALDAALAEVASAMHEQGIRPMLIKGPAVASWLYDDPAERAYGDLDLLVDPELFDLAEAILAQLGFQDIGAGLRSGEREENEHAWLRNGAPPVMVDLHRAIFLIPAPPALAWTLLRAEASEHTLAGARIDTPSPAAHLVILALHAAQHGAEEPKPLADLTRAITRVEPATWQAAAELAVKLGAAAGMREGLKLVPNGDGLADRLGLTNTATRAIRLRARTAPDTSVGIESLVAAHGVRGRLQLLARELLPTPTFMRVWQPLAGRGPFGLSLAYLWRPFWLAAKLPRGSVAWFRAAVPSERRARIPGFVWSACWALRAWLRCRIQLRRGGLEAVRLPPPPTDRPCNQNGVHRMLAQLSASCLERSLVLQAWHAAHGRPRDVMIGVRGPAAEFGAHAWLDGEDSDSSGFEELLRWPPPAPP